MAANESMAGVAFWVWDMVFPEPAGKAFDDRRFASKLAGLRL
jgi:hypothetical protein